MKNCSKFKKIQQHFQFQFKIVIHKLLMSGIFAPQKIAYGCFIVSRIISFTQRVVLSCLVGFQNCFVCPIELKILIFNFTHQNRFSLFKWTLSCYPQQWMQTLSVQTEFVMDNAICFTSTNSLTIKNKEANERAKEKTNNNRNCNI